MVIHRLKHVKEVKNKRVECDNKTNGSHHKIFQVAEIKYNGQGRSYLA
jgi:hypothetical protein